MPSSANRFWQFLGQRPQLYLLLASAFVALAALAISHGRPLDVAFLQFGLGEQQILATHHIQSTFLPIGYSAFYGYLELLAQPLGPAAAGKIVFLAQIGILLAILLFARSILRNYTSARFATTAALLVTLEPALLYNANRVTDANLTLALLLGVLACILRLRRDLTLGNACLCGVLLAAAVLVRPNLLLLGLLLLWAVRREALGRSFALLAISCSVMVLVYVAVTAAVHGKPFLPQNGPYNLYAGFNPRTEQALLTLVNGEVSIVPAMRDLGLHPTLDWHRQSDVPGVDDARDERYIPFYNRESRLFLREHPGRSLDLVGIKLFTFMRPIHENVDQSSGAFNLFREVVKTATLLVIVVWLGVLIYSGVRHLGLARPIFPWAAVLYILPFVLINADPRFRTALEGLVCVDLARMLYLRRARPGISVPDQARLAQR